MSLLERGRTASSYLDTDYATISEPDIAHETLTSALYISSDWLTRAIPTGFSWAGTHMGHRIVSDLAPVVAPEPSALTQAAQSELQRDHKALLRVLAVDHGFTWSDLSRMLGVSVPAIRKWRMDGRVSGDNQRKLAYLSAFARLLGERGIPAASWMSSPMLPDYTVAPKHLYSEQGAEALLDLAATGEEPTQLLDSLDPEWRQRYDAQGHVVVRFDDGTYGVTRR